MDEENNKETTSLLNKKVGNIEPESKKLPPAEITIVGLNEQTEKSNGESFKLPLINFLCKHPDKEEPIKISKIKVLPEDTVLTKTTWGVEDKEGNIQKGSALDDVLSFFKVESLIEIEGKKCHTVVESKDSSFLCLKLFN